MVYHDLPLVASSVVLVMALSSRQVATLFILPVIFAAYIQNQESTELSAKTQQFYCTSNQIKNLVKFMVDVRSSIK